MTDRGTRKKDFHIPPSPKTLKSGLLRYIREMIQDRVTSLHSEHSGPFAQVL